MVARLFREDSQGRGMLGNRLIMPGLRRPGGTCSAAGPISRIRGCASRRTTRTTSQRKTFAPFRSGCVASSNGPRRTSSAVGRRRGAEAPDEGVAILGLCWLGFGCKPAPAPEVVVPRAPAPVGTASASAAVLPPRLPTPTVRIPAGAFTMDCPPSASAVCRDDEKPAHHVTLSAYEIDIYEATVGQYKACCDAGACTCDADTHEIWSSQFEKMTGGGPGTRGPSTGATRPRAPRWTKPWRSASLPMRRSRPSSAPGATSFAASSASADEAARFVRKLAVERTQPAPLPSGGARFVRKLAVERTQGSRGSSARAAPPAETATRTTVIARPSRNMTEAGARRLGENDGARQAVRKVLLELGGLAPPRRGQCAQHTRHQGTRPRGGRARACARLHRPPRRGTVPSSSALPTAHGGPLRQHRRPGTRPGDYGGAAGCHWQKLP
jgi:formylglycine-generating enzyme required for sulfatase activity